jgi:hypothetical protein
MLAADHQDVIVGHAIRPHILWETDRRLFVALRISTFVASFPH